MCWLRCMRSHQAFHGVTGPSGTGCLKTFSQGAGRGCRLPPGGGHCPAAAPMQRSGRASGGQGTRPLGEPLAVSGEWLIDLSRARRLAIRPDGPRARPGTTLERTCGRSGSFGTYLVIRGDQWPWLLVVGAVSLVTSAGLADWRTRHRLLACRATLPPGGVLGF